VAKGGIEPPTRGFSTTLKHRISALVQQLTQPFLAA